MTPVLDSQPTIQPWGDPGGVSLRAALDTVMRRRRLVGGLALSACVLVLGASLIGSRSYTCSTTFMPTAPQGKLSMLGGLAAQFGLSVPSDPGASPAFYVLLLQSRELLRSAVRTTYDVPAKGQPTRTTLVEWYDPPGDTPAEREEAAIVRLGKELRAAVDGETGTVELKVRTGSPLLSLEITRRLMDLVSEFNLQKRQSQAAAERKFVEGRVQEVMNRLAAAEQRLQAFLQHNRDYRNSPPLLFEYDRLLRDVTMQQQVYTSLSQAFEQARIDEVRNTPVLTLVDPPTLPAQPDRRWLLVKGLLALLMGGLVGAFIALARDFLSRDPQISRPTTQPDKAGVAVMGRRP
jgi:uncharacterized protein involved in exopolysaccharide biosynthesis